MTLRTTLPTLLLLSCVAAHAADSPAPDFAKKPHAVKDGGKVLIRFAVTRETDVAVYIEDAQGKVVRHLVAGVLGKNPPPPLAPGLEQSIPWDGLADYGKPAGNGPFKARVALGLGAKYDQVLVREPQNLGTVNYIGVGPGGVLYVLYSLGNVGPSWPSQTMAAFNRDGTYQRTIMPFPNGLKPEQLGGAGVIELDGRPVPTLKSVAGRRFYPSNGFGGSRKSTLAITKQGQIVYCLPGLRLAAVDANGALPFGAFDGPYLFEKSMHTAGTQRIFATASSDGGAVYLTGLGHCSKTISAAKLDNPYPAVFRVKLPTRDKPEIIFGDMKATGSDEKRLGGLPTGTAVDGQGHLLVGDSVNKRVVVLNEKDGSFAGSFAAEGADAIAADPKTGAVYLTRNAGDRKFELVKYSGWKDAKELAALPLPMDIDRENPWMMAADFSAQPPVFWLGGNYGDRGKLLRVEDQGAKFGELKKINTDEFGALKMMDLSVERRSRTVYVESGRRVRFREDTGELSQLGIQPFHGSHQMAPAPDGSLYALSWSEPGRLRKLDADGKPKPWSEGGKPDVNVIVSMNLTPHTLGVRPSDGHAFVMEPAPGTTSNNRVNKRLVEFDLEGKRVEGDSLIWCASDSVIGPRFDAAGNIYIADQVRAKGLAAPPELGKEADYTYGSILKFSPKTSVKGGRIVWPNQDPLVKDNGLPVPKADASLPVIEALSMIQKGDGLKADAQVVGAEWMHFGLSHIDLLYCNCETSRFDVDEFGRVFYPDLCRFRVGVIDTNANQIGHFGGYGNADSMGPDSPVIDPQTGTVRPRRADDPKDLKSPFAEPEIAVAWLNAVVVTDRFAYLADMVNRRLLSAKLVYAAEEICPVP
ncbi:MAG: hypothetical protein L6R28_18035 [Planctomycetes bacterium]|nr:hypothetical protein [Planctomycetota bacterium]